MTRIARTSRLCIYSNPEERPRTALLEYIRSLSGQIRNARTNRSTRKTASAYRRKNHPDASKCGAFSKILGFGLLSRKQAEYAGSLAESLPWRGSRSCRPLLSFGFSARDLCFAHGVPPWFH